MSTTTPRPYGLTGPQALWKDAIAYSDTDPRYRAVLRICARVGWPVAFQSDVYTHDLAFCRENPGKAFVFILRDHGSHCYIIDEDCKGARNWAGRSVQYHSGDHKLNTYGPEDEKPRFYHIGADGSEEEITHHRAYDLVTSLPTTH